MRFAIFSDKSSTFAVNVERVVAVVEVVGAGNIDIWVEGADEPYAIETSPDVTCKTVTAEILRVAREP